MGRGPQGKKSRCAAAGRRSDNLLERTLPTLEKNVVLRFSEGISREMPYERTHIYLPAMTGQPQRKNQQLHWLSTLKLEEVREVV